MATTAEALKTIASDELAPVFAGDIIGHEDDGYEEARRIWNHSIDRRPALIVRPTGVADVIAAVRFAREKDLLVAVRGGSHSIAGFSTCDDGLVIDLGAMKGIRVDPRNRRVHVQGGAVWKELDRETQAFGLAVTGGLISSTGVAGFTLGGGIGWLQRKYGLACDSLVSADVVTADGSVVHASAEHDPDLLWALQGGGGNFGIVTSFEFALHPVGPEIVGGLIAFPGERAAEMLAAYRELRSEAPEELTIAAVLRLAPPAPFIPESYRGKPMVAFAGMHSGPVPEGLEAMQALKDLGEPIADLIGPRPYTQMQTLLDGSWTAGFQNYWKAEYLTGLPDPAVEVMVEFLGSITSPLSDFKIPFLGGTIERVGEDDTAYGHRDAWGILNINARWQDPEDSARHIEWTRALWNAMQPYSAGGTYTNFTSEDEGDRVRGSYGDAKYDRLAELKRRYDPANFFRLNQNIEPASSGH